jgi:hypothetical protein
VILSSVAPLIHERGAGVRLAASTSLFNLVVDPPAGVGYSGVGDSCSLGARAIWLRLERGFFDGIALRVSSAVPRHQSNFIFGHCFKGSDI